MTKTPNCGAVTSMNNQCKCGGSYDEYDLCFECDLPKQERLAQMNRERVQRHRDNKRKTLVKVEVWIRPGDREKLNRLVKGLGYK